MFEVIGNPVDGTWRKIILGAFASMHKMIILFAGADGKIWKYRHYDIMNVS